MLRVEDKYVRSPQSFKRSPESGIGINKSLIGKPTLSNVEGVEFWGFGSEGRKLWEWLWWFPMLLLGWDAFGAVGNDMRWLWWVLGVWVSWVRTSKILGLDRVIIWIEKENFVSEIIVSGMEGVYIEWGLPHGLLIA